MSLIDSLFLPARPARRISLSALFSLHRQRRALSELSPELLDDIGVTQRDAAEEAARPLWDAPDHWFRR